MHNHGCAALNSVDVQWLALKAVYRIHELIVGCAKVVDFSAPLSVMPRPRPGHEPKVFYHKMQTVGRIESGLKAFWGADLEEEIVL